jgi:S-adenosylmethionine/arginine decarboxylase-like enzyme
MSWGYHFALDCRACSIERITSKSNIEKFARELVKRIDMKAYGEPQVVHFGSGDKEGYTLIQLIETSNISAHFCNDTGDAYIDIFSCKEYDCAVVQETVQQFFCPEHISYHYILRQA